MGNQEGGISRNQIQDRLSDCKRGQNKEMDDWDQKPA
jgi:hypothetical protein